MQERRRQKKGNLYGINQAEIIPRPKPIIQDEDPTAADLAEIGTYWINSATQNVFVKGNAAIWIDLAGGPGTGIFDSVTALGTGLPTPPGLGAGIQADVGSFVATLGDMTASNGNFLAPLGTVTAPVATLTSAGAGDTVITGGALTLQNYVDSVLITDANGLVDPAQQQGANGEVIIAASGAGQPQWASITSTAGSVTITPGVNSLNIDITNNIQIDQIDANAGSAIDAANVITFAGGTNMQTSAATNVMTVELLDDITPATSATSSAGALIATTTVTAGTGLTITTGDLAITAGNLTLPSTDLSTPEGAIFLNANRFLHAEADDTNIFLGTDCANATLTGTLNVGIGTALAAQDAPYTDLTTGTDNVSAGNGSSDQLTTGINNVHLGVRAGTNGTDASNNVLVGYLAAETDDDNTIVGVDFPWDHSATATDVIVLGKARMGASVVDNVININNGTTGAAETAGDNLVFVARNTGTAITKVFWEAIDGVTTDSATTNTLLISDGDQLGTIASSRRYKKEIRDMGNDSAPIMNLRPVTFNYKLQRGKPTWPGLIAEEVDEHLPSLVNLDDQGRPDNVRYHDLPVMILNEMIKLNQRLGSLERRYEY